MVILLLTNAITIHSNDSPSRVSHCSHSHSLRQQSVRLSVAGRRRVSMIEVGLSLSEAVTVIDHDPSNYRTSKLQYTVIRSTRVPTMIVPYNLGSESTAWGSEFNCQIDQNDAIDVTFISD